VAKSVDAGDFTGSTSDTSAEQESGFDASHEPADAIDPGATLEGSEPPDVEGLEHSDRHDVGPDEQVRTNGGPRGHQGEDMDMARAIAHELRIINESGDPMPSTEQP
jgi:hypothetical protein